MPRNIDPVVTALLESVRELRANTVIVSRQHPERVNALLAEQARIYDRIDALVIAQRNAEGAH